MALPVIRATLVHMGFSQQASAFIIDEQDMNDLEEFIVKGKSRAIRDFILTQNYSAFRLEDTPVNRKAFTNINSPEDLDNLNYGL